MAEKQKLGLRIPLKKFAYGTKKKQKQMVYVK